MRPWRWWRGVALALVLLAHLGGCEGETTDTGTDDPGGVGGGEFECEWECFPCGCLSSEYSSCEEQYGGGNCGRGTGGAGGEGGLGGPAGEGGIGSPGGEGGMGGLGG